MQQDIGFAHYLRHWAEDRIPAQDLIGRVTSEHKDRFLVRSSQTEYEAELLGKLRYSASTRQDLPAVGDYVVLSVYDEDKALITNILPRYSILQRQAAGVTSNVQIIGTNIDVALIIQAVDRDFNLNRVERYLTVCHASGVAPVVLLSKADLVESMHLEQLILQVQDRLPGIHVISTSHHEGEFDEIKQLLEAGKTYCMLGSSGVGKSTLLNGLSGSDVMKTSAISESVNKGRHTTSHRALIVLPTGAIIIDNPGMREVGIADEAHGLESTFSQIVAVATQCHFKDCSHTTEKGCAVLAALEEGQIDQDAYANFIKMQREKLRFQDSIRERRKKDRDQGKLYKRIQDHKRRRKF